MSIQEYKIKLKQFQAIVEYVKDKCKVCHRGLEQILNLLSSQQFDSVYDKLDKGQLCKSCAPHNSIDFCDYIVYYDTINNQNLLSKQTAYANPKTNQKLKIECPQVKKINYNPQNIKPEKLNDQFTITLPKLQVKGKPYKGEINLNFNTINSTKEPERLKQFPALSCTKQNSIYQLLSLQMITSKPVDQKGNLILVQNQNATMKVESNIDPIDVQTIKSMKVLEYDPVDETFKQLNQSIKIDMENLKIQYNAPILTLPYVTNSLQRLSTKKQKQKKIDVEGQVTNLQNSIRDWNPQNDDYIFIKSRDYSHLSIQNERQINKDRCHTFIPKIMFKSHRDYPFMEQFVKEITNKLQNLKQRIQLISVQNLFEDGEKEKVQKKKDGLIYCKYYFIEEELVDIIGQYLKQTNLINIQKQVKQLRPERQQKSQGQTQPKQQKQKSEQQSNKQKQEQQRLTQEKLQFLVGYVKQRIMVYNGQVAHEVTKTQLQLYEIMKLRNKVEHIEKAANQQKLKNKFKKGLPIAKQEDKAEYLNQTMAVFSKQEQLRDIIQLKYRQKEMQLTKRVAQITTQVIIVSEKEHIRNLVNFVLWMFNDKNLIYWKYRPQEQIQTSLLRKMKSNKLKIQYLQKQKQNVESQLSQQQSKSKQMKLSIEQLKQLQLFCVQQCHKRNKQVYQIIKQQLLQSKTEGVDKRISQYSSKLKWIIQDGQKQIRKTISKDFKGQQQQLKPFVQNLIGSFKRTNQSNDFINLLKVSQYGYLDPTSCPFKIDIHETKKENERKLRQCFQSSKLKQQNCDYQEKGQNKLKQKLVNPRKSQDEMLAMLDDAKKQIDGINLTLGNLSKRLCNIDSIIRQLKTTQQKISDPLKLQRQNLINQQKRCKLQKIQYEKNIRQLQELLTKFRSDQANRQNKRIKQQAQRKKREQTVKQQEQKKRREKQIKDQQERKKQQKRIQQQRQKQNQQRRVLQEAEKQKQNKELQQSNDKGETNKDVSQTDTNNIESGEENNANNNSDQKQQIVNNVLQGIIGSNQQEVSQKLQIKQKLNQQINVLKKFANQIQNDSIRIRDDLKKVKDAQQKNRLNKALSQKNKQRIEKIKSLKAKEAQLLKFKKDIKIKQNIDSMLKKIKQAAILNDDKINDSQKQSRKSLQDTDQEIQTKVFKNIRSYKAEEQLRGYIQQQINQYIERQIQKLNITQDFKDTKCN